MPHHSSQSSLSTHSQLVQPLIDGPIDIIGDIHGEIDALRSLLTKLGVDLVQQTVQRPLVFVGDLVDRGPDSVAVLDLVKGLVDRGQAQCILGNHEFNLLNQEEKEGNGWFMGHHDTFQVKSTHQESLDSSSTSSHIPFDSQAVGIHQKKEYLNFISQLPLCLEREDLRVVHACWDSHAIQELPTHGDVVQLKKDFDRKWKPSAEIAAQIKAELNQFKKLKNIDCKPTHILEHFTVWDVKKNANPITRLTSGKEKVITHIDQMQYKGGKWRQVVRDRWWHDYHEEPAVIVGHYWRSRQAAKDQTDDVPWNSTRFTDWVGAKGNVFCVDYSVGYRYKERYQAQQVHASKDQSSPSSHYGLAALRWPERVLVFDDIPGEYPTTAWRKA